MSLSRRTFTTLSLAALSTPIFAPAVLGQANVSAQGLPGFLGKDGWLARAGQTSDLFICRMPGLTTAPRLDIHFWWNIGEIVLLVAAAHSFLRSRWNS